MSQAALAGIPADDERLACNPPSSSGSRALAFAEVVGLYSQQEGWFAHLHQVQSKDLPSADACPLPMYKQLTPAPILLIFRLFSGRRRDCYDFRFWMTEWGRRKGLQVCVISADTAVSERYGNLAPGSKAALAINECYDNKVVGAALCGPPCETFIEGRRRQPSSEPDAAAGCGAALPSGSDGGQQTARPDGWPRPLRSCARAAGLDDLTIKEMRQFRIGSHFMFGALSTWGTFHHGTSRSSFAGGPCQCMVYCAGGPPSATPGNCPTCSVAVGMGR